MHFQFKDVKNLNLTKNPTFSVADEKSSPYICPVIGLEMSGKFRFVALWTCGCVFSERALKEVKVNHCHKVSSFKICKGIFALLFFY